MKKFKLSIAFIIILVFTLVYYLFQSERKTIQAAEPLSLSAQNCDGSKTGESCLAVLNVGQGSCTLITCHNTEKFLVDCGTSSSMDSAALLVKSYLEQIKVYDKSTPPKASLKGILLSHPDKDHVNLLPRLFSKDDDIDAIFYAGQDSTGYKDYGKDDATKKFLNDIINRTSPPAPRNIYLNRVHDKKTNRDFPCVNGDNIGFRVLEANKKGKAIEGEPLETEVNRRSVVLTYKDNNFSVMIPGDADTQTKKSVQKEYSSTNITTDILVGSHHGEFPGSFLLTWPGTVQPKALIYSARERTDYRHPRCAAIDVFKTYEASKNRLLKTDPHKITCGLRKGQGYKTYDENMMIFGTQTIHSSDTGGPAYQNILVHGKNNTFTVYSCPSDGLGKFSFSNCKEMKKK